MPRAYLVNVEAGQNDTRKKTIKINNDFIIMLMLIDLCNSLYTFT